MAAKVMRKWVEGRSAPCTSIHTPADRSAKKYGNLFRERKVQSVEGVSLKPRVQFSCPEKRLQLKIPFLPFAPTQASTGVEAARRAGSYYILCATGSCTFCILYCVLRARL